MQMKGSILLTADLHSPQVHSAFSFLLSSHSTPAPDIIPAMLRRILLAMSILSLLLGAVVLIFWWRSYSHVDHFSLGRLDNGGTEFTSTAGKLMVGRSQSIGGMIVTQSTIYPYRSFWSASLIIPAFWVAITIRSKLPHPGRPPQINCPYRSEPKQDRKDFPRSDTKPHQGKKTNS